VSGRAPASTLAHYAHRFVFDLLLIDASVRSALSYTLDRLEAKGHGRKLFEQLTIALSRRALAQSRQEVAVDLNPRGAMFQGYRSLPGWKDHATP